MKTRILRGLAIASTVGVAAYFAAPSQGDDFHLESASLPAPLLQNGKPNLVIEASGVEPIGDGRRVLIAHDKHPSLFVVDVATGRILGEPITTAKFPTPSKTGPKWEGMALDSEGNYYLIGAHNGKTEEERATKSVLLRFRLEDANSDAPRINDASVLRMDISRSLVAAMKTAGVEDAGIAKRKIEGLAVRERSTNGKTRRDLLIGLREPSDKVRGFVADITASPSPDAELELKPAFAFEAEPREGVASQLCTMEYVPALGGLLIVTASEDTDNAFHGNTMYFVADGETSSAIKIGTFEVAMKCEGLAVLGIEKNGAKTSVKLLVTFDNDPHATKIPSRYQTVTLVRETR